MLAAPSHAGEIYSFRKALPLKSYPEGAGKWNLASCPGREMWMLLNNCHPCHSLDRMFCLADQQGFLLLFLFLFFLFFGLQFCFVLFCFLINGHKAPSFPTIRTAMRAKWCNSSYKDLFVLALGCAPGCAWALSAARCHLEAAEWTWAGPLTSLSAFWEGGAKTVAPSQGWRTNYEK